MSLRPNGFKKIPAETSRVARAAFPKGCLAMRARDALGPLLTDEQFSELFPARGTTSVVTGAAGRDRSTARQQLALGGGRLERHPPM